MLLIILMCFLPLRSLAQNLYKIEVDSLDASSIQIDSIGTITKAWYEDKHRNRYKNGEFDTMDDRHPKNHEIAYFVNGVFVKSLLGIDRDDKKERTIIVNAPRHSKMALAMPFTAYEINSMHDSLVIDSVPVLINGKEYRAIINAIGQEPVELISLEEIRAQYCPYADRPFLYIVDGMMLLTDVESYKFQRDYILRIDLYKSEDIESLKGTTPFYVLKIYTAKRRNLGLSR